MHKFVVYIRGNPGVGKITVARILEKELGWKLFWFHDLKNAVYDIVKVHRIPRLMDEVTQPVFRFLLDQGDNLIYVRPSGDKETVEAVHATVNKYKDYIFIPVRLTASYDTLLQRATSRDDPYRITSKKELDNYLNTRVTTEVDGELVIDTDNLTPQQVAEIILKKIREY